MQEWQRFVLKNGRHARKHHLAAVLDKDENDVARIQAIGCAPLKKMKGFVELFTLWHGRAPKDREWPAPRLMAGSGYEWQAPELALITSLVGRFGKDEIAKILTRRLRKLTGDRQARRNLMAVQNGITRVGLQVQDIVGGITVAAAGREIGAYYVVWQAVKRKSLKAFRVGRVIAIRHADWKAWKAKRVFPPKGFVQLRGLKRALGIRSDKLSEWARLGYVPSAIRCNPYGSRAASTHWGTWWIDKKVERKLIADRRAGRPMPWWGKAEPCNMRTTWKLLEERRHPPSCRTCAQIWGPKGAPTRYDDYAVRYPPLEHGAKRHLTRKFSRGLTPAQVARHCGRSVSAVMRAIKNDMIGHERLGWRYYVTRTEATRWKARRCPLGSGYNSWLSIEWASKQYLFKRSELRALIRKGKLRSKVGTAGQARGIVYVPRHQLAVLRERIGFTEKEAARRARVTVTRLRNLLKGIFLHGAKNIPLQSLQAAIKRIQSREGYTIEGAAEKIGKTLKWVEARILDGTVRVKRGKWDRRRKYITTEMLARLQKEKRAKRPELEDLGPDWLFVSEAAREAGVSTGQIQIWGDAGELRRQRTHLGYRYSIKAIRARARRYWQKPRLKRSVPPTWLQLERGQIAANDDLMAAAA